MSKILLDAHLDMLLDVLEFRRRGKRAVLENRFLPHFRAGGVNAVVCSLFVYDELLPEQALRNALDQISALKNDLKESHSFALCKNAQECRKVTAEGNVALFLSFEGAEPLGNDPFLLPIFYDLGVRFLGLAWSRRNYACDGVSFCTQPEGTQQSSLTDFGRDLVAKANELGMIIDVSHLNDAGFAEVAEIAKRNKLPFMASHSDCRALCSNPRNLADWQLDALAEAGGVTGMNAYTPFIADDPAERTPEKFLAHLEYVVKRCGIEHAGIGLDLCGCVEEIAKRSENTGDRDIFGDHETAAEQFFNPIRERYSEKDADAIFGENFLRVFERVLK